jgi:hypothetical protein
MMKLLLLDVVFNKHRLGCYLVFIVILIHGGLLAFSAIVHSPTYSESMHLPAGLSHIHLGRFVVYRVNPPLARTVAALPIA